MLKGILFCFLAAISTVSYAQDVEDLIIKLDSTVSYLIDTLNISPEQKLDLKKTNLAILECVISKVPEKKLLKEDTLIIFYSIYPPAGRYFGEIWSRNFNYGYQYSPECKGNIIKETKPGFVDFIYERITKKDFNYISEKEKEKFDKVFGPPQIGYSVYLIERNSGQYNITTFAFDEYPSFLKE